MPADSPLIRLARGSGRVPAAQVSTAATRAADVAERCDLCGTLLPARHRHLLDLEKQKLACACPACSLLFDHPANQRHRLIPQQRRLLEPFDLDDALWEELRVPVGIAFFVLSSAAGRIVAYYPSPVGATESLLALDAWRAVEARNPALIDLQPDVEALLVQRRHPPHQHWLVGIDECYALVGIVRKSWRGLGGGEEVWERVTQFFAALRQHGGAPMRETSRSP